MKKVVVGLLIVFAYLAAYLYININVSGLVALVGSLDLFFDAALLRDIPAMLEAVNSRSLSGYVLIVSMILSSVIFVLFTLMVNYKNLRKPGWFKGFKGLDLVFTLSFAVGCALLMAFLLIYIFPDFINSMPVEVQEVFASMAATSPWLMLLTVGVFAPVAEEVLFRGAIFNVLKNRINAGVAIVVSAVLFAAFHMNWYQASYALVLGLVLGLIAYKSGSLILPIIFHMVYNILVSLPELLPKSLMDFLFIESYVFPVLGLLFFNAGLVYFLGRKVDVEESPVGDEVLS